MSKDHLTSAQYQALLAGKKPKAIPAPKPAKAVSPKQQMNIGETEMEEAFSCITINGKAMRVEYSRTEVIFEVKGRKYLIPLAALQPLTLFFCAILL